MESSESQNKLPESLTVEEVEASYARLRRALRSGAFFAAIAVVMLLVTRPPFFFEIAVILVAVEFFSYRFFTQKYSQTRDDLIAAIEADQSDPVLEHPELPDSAR